MCTAHRLSQGRVVSHGRAESGPSMTTVVEAVAKLAMTDAHSQECMDALKQLLCLSHFSPCEGGNQTAPGRPACSPDCTELFTGRCQDLWEAYLNTVAEGSAAYKDHIEGCALDMNGQDCVLLFASSETPTGTAKPSTPGPPDAVGKYGDLSSACACECVAIPKVLTGQLFLREAVLLLGHSQSASFCGHKIATHSSCYGTTRSVGYLNISDSILVSIWSRKG